MNTLTHDDLISQLEAAQAHVRAGQHPQAAEIYQRILQVQPDQEIALSMLGALHQHHGNHPLALELIGRASRNNPENAQLHINLATSHAATGNMHGAVAELETGMKFDPTNQRAYDSLIVAALDTRYKRAGTAVVPEYIFTHPPLSFFRLQIEITTWCNLKCAGCPRTIDIHKGTWKNVHMTMEQFKKIVDNLPPSGTLCMQGVGESTLHPEFIEMVAYARSTGKYQTITVNSNALAKPLDYYRKLKDAGLTFISLSVDSFDPEIAEACRSGTKVDKLRERVQAILELYAPNISAVTTVVSKRNLDDVANTIDALAQMRYAGIELQPMIVYDPENGSEGNSSVALTPDDIKRLDDIRGAAHAKYPHLQFIGADTDGGALPRNIRCLRPFKSPYVTADGYLTPCCTCEDPAVLGHVNVAEMPFAEAWQQPGVQNWLRAYVQPRPLAMCVGCCFFTS